MSNKPAVTIASRAHRALRGLPRFQFASSVSLEISGIDSDDNTHGEIIGVYENPSGVEPSHIVIADSAIGCVEASEFHWIQYDHIVRIEGPKEKLAADRIDVVLRSGETVQLRIAGGEGKFRDVFNFVRFLDRVLLDNSSSGDPGS